MLYKTYGKTGLSVSAIGFGGMRFDISLSNDENARLLPYALEKGINYFDTAPGYCEDHSEDIFGLALSKMKSQREKFYVSTKGMPENFDTAEKAIAAVQHSLSRLKCDYLDFYHVWCIRRLDQYELAMRPGGQYEGLLRCKEKGLIRHIVVSSHLRGPEIVRLVQNREFEGILLGVNILNFLYRWQGVEAAHQAGMGIVAMNPLAGGIIPKNEKQLAFLADPGETPTEAAIRFCVSCPQITVTLVGFTTKDHIDTACRVADTAKPFSQKDIQRIRQHITKNMDQLCTGCGYCMGQCPKDIPVAAFMQYYNDKILAGKTDTELAKELGFQKQWGILADRRADAKDCTQCGRCELACTQHLDIMQRMETLASWENTVS
jgi:predicted aldo/keto reductase-like oxidoreductase